MKTEEKSKEAKKLESIKSVKQLVLYNDDVNDFNFIIKCLKEVCGHDYIQAEQGATIAHHKGKCILKTDVREKLSYNCFKLLELGLSAEVI